jgi:hypothetical protein
MRRWKATGRRVKHRDLARVLVAIQTYYDAFGEVPADFQGASNVPIPAEVLAIIGEELVGPSDWAAEQNEAKAAIAHARTERIQQAAERHWEINPSLSKQVVAEKIVADPAMRTIITIRRGGTCRLMTVGTVRQLIQKK